MILYHNKARISCFSRSWFERRYFSGGNGMSWGQNLYWSKWHKTFIFIRRLNW